MAPSAAVEVHPRSQAIGHARDVIPRARRTASYAGISSAIAIELGGGVRLERHDVQRQTQKHHGRL